MPLDPLDPGALLATPEERLASRLKSAARQNDQLQRASLNRITRGRLYDEELSEVSTTNLPYVDLGGPSLTLAVPSDAFVAVFFQCELHGDGGNPGAGAGLHEPTDLPIATRLVSTNQAAYEVWRTGSPRANELGWQVMLPATPGTRTYTVVYRAETGSGTAFFRNRRLWAEVI